MRVGAFLTASWAFVYLFGPPGSALASVTVRVCTENLERVGKASFGKHAESTPEQTAALVARFQEARCDVIAVQEVYGKSKEEGAETLERLSSALSRAAGEEFKSFVGESQFDEIRNGFILRSRLGRVLQLESPDEPDLPKLVPLERSHRPTRLPLALVLDVAGAGQQLILVNIHLKSKVGSFKDPTGTEYETIRMESSEQARQFVKHEQQAVKHPGVTVILGDRNALPASASAAILSGSLRLKDFQLGGACRLNDQLEPACGERPGQPEEFVPIFTNQSSEGSDLYHGKQEMIDAVYLDAAYFKERNGKIGSGIVGRFFVGSDHKLLWVDLPL